MKNHALAIVGGVFLLLVVLWIATADSQPKVGIKELKVARIDKDQVKKIEVTLPGKEKKKDENAPDEGPIEATFEPARKIVLEKDGAGFVVYDAEKADKKYPVDDTQLKPLLDAIGEFQTGDLVANKAEKLKDFEIDDAKGLRVAVTTQKGKELDLIFGRAAKGGGTTVRAEGSNDVFVAKGRLGSLARKEISGWRKKSILDKKAEDFTNITIARADGTKLVLVSETKEEEVPVEGAEATDAGTATTKKKTTTWKLTEPETLPAGYRLDSAALGRIASSLATLRATDFADDATDATAGFDVAHTVVSAKVTDGKDVVIHLGKKDDKNRVPVRLGDDKQVYLIAEYAAKNLDKGLDDLRDLSLFSASVDDVQQATFTADKTRIVVARNGGGWKLVEPKTPPADFDEGQIGSAIAAALRVRGTRLAAGEQSAGGADPVIEITLRSGTKQTVRFGKGVSDPGAKDDKPKDFLAQGADGLVYVVNSYTRGRYEKPVELFKKPAPPPGGTGGLSGLDSLPPDVRKKLEASLKAQQ